MPIWWAMMHALSKGFTAAAVASIPCGADLRQMRMEVDNTRINNPLLAQEVADFSRDCYGPSRARLFMRQPDLGSVAENNKALQDLSWIGSRYLLNTPGYYDTDYSKTPREPWPYNATRDAGLPQVGERLMVLSSERYGSDAGPVQAGISRRLEQRRDSLRDELEKLRRLQDDERDSLTSKVASLQRELTTLAAQTDSQQRLLALASDAAARYQGLMDKGYISMDQLQQRQAELLGQRQTLQGLERERTSLRQQLTERRNELAGLSARQANQLARPTARLRGRGTHIRRETPAQRCRHGCR